MENGEIKDSQVTASSVKRENTEYQPFSARLHNQLGNWRPGSDSVGEWLQIDFSDRVAVTKVATQGRNPSGDYRNWVTSYKLSFSRDAASWKFFEESGQEKVRTKYTCSIAVWKRKMESMEFSFRTSTATGV